MMGEARITALDFQLGTATIEGEAAFVGGSQVSLWGIDLPRCRAMEAAFAP